MLLDLMKNTVWHIYSHQGQSNTMLLCMYASVCLYVKRTFQILIFFPFAPITIVFTGIEPYVIFLIRLLQWKAHKKVNISYAGCRKFTFCRIIENLLFCWSQAEKLIIVSYLCDLKMLVSLCDYLTSLINHISFKPKSSCLSWCKLFLCVTWYE